jgi:hypothetical protein
MSHSWCQNIQRDEAVRAAEDNRTGPLPTLEAVIAEPFADQAKCSPTVSETGETQSRLRTERVTERRPPEPGGGGNVTGLRTELVTLEVTHRFADPIASVLLQALDSVLSGQGESVFVMDGSCEITKLADERDAAIRKLDTLRAERITQALTADRFAAAVAEADTLKARVAELTQQTIKDHALICKISNERDAAIRERDAAKSDAERSAVLIKSQAANVAYFRRDRDETRLRAEAAEARVAELESAKLAPEANADDFSNQQPISGDGKSAVNETQPAPGWLTEEEREALRWVGSITPISDRESRRRFSAIRGLLSRSGCKEKS